MLHLVRSSEGMDIVNKIAGDRYRLQSDRPLDGAEDEKSKPLIQWEQSIRNRKSMKKKKHKKRKRNSRIIATSNTYDAEENKRWKMNPDRKN